MKIDIKYESLEYKEEIDENGLNLLAAWRYHYPCDLPVRKYQLDVVKKSLFSNVLLCLPTGLGKTFIASVVMVNFYHWFPRGKLIFIAPTKPLVQQQYEACYKIGGIPYRDCCCLTGSIVASKREEMYKIYRTFFMTSQTLKNDIESYLILPSDIICLVIDEAHKATGNHAYMQVVNSIINSNNRVRILALTASPGEDLKKIQTLVDNLNINEIIHYNEDDLKIKQYTHNREVIEKIITHNEFTQKLVDEFSLIINEKLQLLANNNVITNPSIISWPAYRLLKILQNMSTRKNRFAKDKYSWLCKEIMTTHFYLGALEKINIYGILAFVRNITSKGIGEFKKYQDFYHKILSINDDFERSIRFKQSPSFPFHPKISQLIQLLNDHFLTFTNSSVIVFTNFRDSVDEIVFALSLVGNNIRPIEFIGQASSKHSRGLLQKEQLEIIEKFRSTQYNVLVSTSIGEEGLDIGHVRLIVFFDISTSPLRLIQRMGRTGRKESGYIVLLLMQGSEQKAYLRAKSKSNSMSNALNKISKVTNIPIIPLIPTYIKPILVMSKMGKCQENDNEILLNYKSDMKFSKNISNQSFFHILGNTNIYHSNKSVIKYKIHTKQPIFYVCDNLYTHEIISKTNKSCIKNESDDIITPPDLHSFVKVSNKQSSPISIISHNPPNNNSPSPLIIKRKRIQKISDDSLNDNISTSKRFKTNSPQNVITGRQLSDDSLDDNISTSKRFKTNSPQNVITGRQFLCTQASVEGHCSDDSIINDSHFVQDSFINDESIDISKNISIYNRSLISTQPRLNPISNIIKKIEQNLQKDQHTSPIIVSDDNCEIIKDSSKSDHIYQSRQLISLDILKVSSSSNISQSSTTQSSQLLKSYILVSSKVFHQSLIPNILRNKYQIELINFINMPFDYILNNQYYIDTIKSNQLVNTNFINSLISKYNSIRYMPRYLFIIIQLHQNDQLDLTETRLNILYNILKKSNCLSISILFSKSQEKTSALINQIYLLIHHQSHFQLPDIKPIVLSHLIKCASMLITFNIVSPISAINLLLGAKSLRNLIISGTPDLYRQWSPDISNYHAQMLYNLFGHQPSF